MTAFHHYSALVLVARGFKILKLMLLKRIIRCGGVFVVLRQIQLIVYSIATTATVSIENFRQRSISMSLLFFLYHISASQVGKWLLHHGVPRQLKML